MADNQPTWSVDVKRRMAAALENLPATSDGTEVQAVVQSGEDAFDQYPTIRIVPNGINRIVNSQQRYIDYEIALVVSTYLDLGKESVPDAAVIDTMLEIVDNIFDRLDEADWLPEGEKTETFSVMEGVQAGVIDTTPSKTGTALYCDIVYPVRFRTVVGNE